MVSRELECKELVNRDRERALAWKREAEAAKADAEKLRAEVGRLIAMVERPVADAIEEARLGREEAARLAAIVHKQAAELRRLEAILDVPEVDDFMRGVPLESAHQRKRWGTEHDAGKTPEDWLFLVGYLGTKACQAHRAGDLQKAKHHTISTGGALANWHLAISGKTDMRPGIEPPEGA